MKGYRKDSVFLKAHRAVCWMWTLVPFPFVTSSNTISAGVCTGFELKLLKKIREVFGVSKACAPVWVSGPFPTELHDETGELIRKTKRVR